MNDFSIFSAKVLVCALVAFAPMALLFTGFEVTTVEVARAARAQNQPQDAQPARNRPPLQAQEAGPSLPGVVVG